MKIPSKTLNFIEENPELFIPHWRMMHRDYDDHDDDPILMCPKNAARNLKKTNEIITEVCKHCKNLFPYLNSKSLLGQQYEKLCPNNSYDYLYVRRKYHKVSNFVAERQKARDQKARKKDKIIFLKTKIQEKLSDLERTTSEIEDIKKEIKELEK